MSLIERRRPRPVRLEGREVRLALSLGRDFAARRIFTFSRFEPTFDWIENTDDRPKPTLLHRPWNLPRLFGRARRILRENQQLAARSSSGSGRSQGQSLERGIGFLPCP